MNGRKSALYVVAALFAASLVLLGALPAETTTVVASGRRTPTPVPGCGFVCQAKATARAICGAAFEKDVINDLWLELDAFAEEVLYEGVVSTSNNDMTPYYRGMIVCGAILSYAVKENATWIGEALGRLPRNCGYRCQAQFYTERFCPDVMKAAGSSRVLEDFLRIANGNAIHAAFLTCGTAHDKLLKKECGWVCEVDKEVRRVCRSHFAKSPTSEAAYEIWMSDPRNRAMVLAVDAPVTETAQTICDALRK